MTAIGTEGLANADFPLPLCDLVSQHGEYAEGCQSQGGSGKYRDDGGPMALIAKRVGQKGVERLQFASTSAGSRRLQRRRNEPARAAARGGATSTVADCSALATGKDDYARILQAVVADIAHHADDRHWTRPIAALE